MVTTRSAKRNFGNSPRTFRKRVRLAEPTQTKALAAVIGECSGLTPILPARGQSFELE